MITMDNTPLDFYEFEILRAPEDSCYEYQLFTTTCQAFDTVKLFELYTTFKKKFPTKEDYHINVRYVSTTKRDVTIQPPNIVRVNPCP